MKTGFISKFSNILWQNHTDIFEDLYYSVEIYLFEHTNEYDQNKKNSNYIRAIVNTRFILKFSNILWENHTDICEDRYCSLEIYIFEERFVAMSMIKTKFHVWLLTENHVRVSLKQFRELIDILK